MLRSYELYSISGNNLCRHFRNDLGLLLKLEREKLGLTEVELSHQLRIKLKVIQKMEQGLCAVNWSSLCRMLQFYNKLIEVRLEPMPNLKNCD